MSLPESWVQARLTDVCELNPRLLAESRPASDATVTFVPMSAVDEHGGVIDKAETRTFVEVAKGYTSFREQDVLFAKVTPCMENGKAAIARNLENGFGFGSTEFHVLRPTKVVLPEYVFSFIRQKAFRDRAASAFVGTGGLQRVPPDFLSRVKIPLPTLLEQQRIVDVLRQVEAVTKAKKSISDQVDHLIRTAYWEYFGAWFTADGLIDPVRISDCVADSQYGLSEAMGETGTHAVLRMNSMTTSGWLDLTDLKYAHLSKKDIESTELRDGDLLFNRTNSKELVGKCAIWRPVEGAFSFASYLVRLRLKPDMLPEFLWATLNSAYGKYRLLNSAKQAVSMANVSPTDLGRITVPLPPLSLQQKFARLVREIETLRAQMLGKIEMYSDLQEIICQQALVGQLTTQWRESHADEIVDAAKARDALLLKNGTKISLVGEAKVSFKVQADLSVRPARRWLSGELSEFQRQVLEAFKEYCQQSGQPLLVEDPELFSRFCDDSIVADRLQSFGLLHGNRIRRALSQLSALGLIAKITLPKQDLASGELDYLKAFRLLRPEEFSRMADVEALRKACSSNVAPEYYFTMHLDYETSEHSGAGGMFQVISVQDDDGKDFTHLVDRSRHYASLDDVKEDIARALNVEAGQVNLEAV
ncbi:restriction endonuclease subunit S [Aquipseudomonas alcaligenes]|uniref:Restriction endonuclease subunit S n=1 Tax=Aquipseudomonas alcaligenes TaxID=43263 RepID=A0A2V4LFZ2_AQUAC|nr:restriction endonuclease subunit S [Pseudomonas alcaligenes]PYC19987.1 restriction endonuclease subunit S [Pseudomonas alcaligenes]